MHTLVSMDECSASGYMPESEISDLERLAEAGQKVIRGNYRAASHRFDLTRQGSCPEELGYLAEGFGLRTAKVDARELALVKALSEVRRKDADLKEAAQLRAEFSKLLIGTIITLCCYTMLVTFLRDVRHVDMTPLASATHLVNLCLFGMLGGSMAWFLHRHRYPMNTFGLTWKNWRRSLIESLLVCIPVLGLLVIFKALLVHFDPSYRGQPLIQPTLGSFPWQTFLLYVLVCFSQELSTRGFLQTCIERVLEGKRRTTLAIFLGAAEFGVLHLHYSFQLSVLAFLGAALFGSLYARHRTIVGITVTHYIIGVCVFGPLQLVR
jgi:membrane protease YdiL (CAAX protease family)